MDENEPGQPYGPAAAAAAPPPDAATLRARLNLETAVIAWEELARHFARGAVLTVDRELDLIEAAAAVAEDDRQRVGAWLEENRLHPTTIAEAREWTEGRADVWSVVVAPWVLVQAIA
ncbi:MAG: DUF2288 domain-containing protein [Gammaproteobacteria bacterium]|nr:DUF2288 domain-containing protein [Gammaproteobacteria bacterium]